MTEERAADALDMCASWRVRVGMGERGSSERWQHKRQGQGAPRGEIEQHMLFKMEKWKSDLRVGFQECETLSTTFLHSRTVTLSNSWAL